MLMKSTLIPAASHRRAGAWPVWALVLPLLAGCQVGSTRVLSEWQDAALSERPFRQLVIVALEKNEGLRRILEDEFVRQLGAVGVTALATYPEARFSLEAIDADRAAAAEAMRGLGADGVLLVRLVDERTVKRYVRQPPSREALMPTRFDPAVPRRSWTEFYHSSFLEAGRVYEEQVDRMVSAESNLYALEGERLNWSACTETFVQHGARTDVKARAFVATLVKRLREAGAIAAAAPVE